MSQNLYYIYLVPVHLFFSCKSFPLSIFWGLLSSHEYKINNQTGGAIFLCIVFWGVFLSIKKNFGKKSKECINTFLKNFLMKWCLSDVCGNSIKFSFKKVIGNEIYFFSLNYWLINKLIDSSSAARGDWGCWGPEETAVRGQEEGTASGRRDAGHEASPGGTDVTQQWPGAQATTVSLY